MVNLAFILSIKEKTKGQALGLVILVRSMNIDSRFCVDKKKQKQNLNKT